MITLDFLLLSAGWLTPSPYGGEGWGEGLLLLVEVAVDQVGDVLHCNR